MLKQLSLKNKIQIHNLIIMISLYILAFLLYSLPLNQDINQWINNNINKLRYTIKGKEKTASTLCVFNIDDSDIEQIKELQTTPSDRSIFSEFINLVTRAQAKTILFDILFLKNSHTESDQKIVQSTKHSRRVFYPILSSTIETSQTSAQNSELLDKILLSPKVLKKGSPYNIDSFRTPFSDLTEASQRLGAVALKPDSDAINRKLPLIFSYQNRNEYIPSLVFLGICHFWDIELKKLEISFGNHIKLQSRNKTKNYYIPIDNKGCLHINYIGPWADTKTSFSMKNILKFKDTDSDLLKGYFADTLVLISDISTEKNDYSHGVFESPYPNSGVLMNALNTILTENYIFELNIIFLILFYLPFLIFTGVIVWKFNLKKFSLVFILLNFVYIILSVFLYFNFKLLPQLSFQLWMTLILFSAVIIYKKTMTKEDKISANNIGEVRTKSEVLENLSLIEKLDINEQACREFDITPAQRKLLKIIQQGYTYNKSASILGISENTVKKQVDRIKKKTDTYQKKEFLDIFFPLSE